MSHEDIIKWLILLAILGMTIAILVLTVRIHKNTKQSQVDEEIPEDPDPGSIPEEKKGGKGGNNSDSAPDPRKKQEGPIQMGTSGGWSDDFANGYCCGGTLGALVKDAEKTTYVLSNFHVISPDSVEGDNGRVSQVGDVIVHPGLIDTGCNPSSSRAIATLSRWNDPIRYSPSSVSPNVDAAIAAVIDEKDVDTSGAILGIGPISSTPLSKENLLPGLRVKKMGRTTGLTQSKIEALDVTLSVGYSTECSGQSRGSASFTGQILISNKGNKFLNGGDSGSLLVEAVDQTPRPIGLLFAGSNQFGVANPIEDVMASLEVSMVGVDNPVGARGSKGRMSKKFKAAFDANRKYSRKIMGLGTGIIGHGVGVDLQGNPMMRIYIDSHNKPTKQIPKSFDGIPALHIHTNPILAF